ncbi:Tubulin-tyrosine ligase family protein [Besnoitia besnoiti]|uniref:Tubulin-tyrosine ligase family protein n=1 Tax=Besnoitia besnoiti TaxID=94643 RepID=A0A2A9MAE6_BESBE|nr:Tubulin-tyrosine ligase family protein [Besnoitia besnoiti]PFH34965.1 Tubulin-tyrosine ligase family protein [Besnoitia besnoiti]
MTNTGKKRWQKKESSDTTENFRETRKKRVKHAPAGVTTDKSASVANRSCVNKGNKVLAYTNALPHGKTKAPVCAEKREATSGATEDTSESTRTRDGSQIGGQFSVCSREADAGKLQTDNEVIPRSASLVYNSGRSWGRESTLIRSVSESTHSRAPAAKSTADAAASTNTSAATCASDKSSDHAFSCRRGRGPQAEKPQAAAGALVRKRSFEEQNSTRGRRRSKSFAGASERNPEQYSSEIAKASFPEIGAPGESIAYSDGKALYRARSLCTATLTRHGHSQLGRRLEKQQTHERAFRRPNVRSIGREDASDASLFLYVDHDLAHKSIRSSAQGVIGAIATALEAIQRRLPPDSKEDGLHERARLSADELPAAPRVTSLPSEMQKSEARDGNSAAHAKRSGDEGKRQGGRERPEDDVRGRGLPGSHPPRQAAAGIIQACNLPKDQVDDETLLSGSSVAAEATMETVYNLLASVDAHHLRATGEAAQSSLLRDPPCDIGWKIELGKDDTVDAVNQTISIKQKEGEDCRANVLIIPERASVTGSCAPLCASATPCSPASDAFDSWDGTYPSESPKGRTATEPARPQEPMCSKGDSFPDPELLRQYTRQFPTLGDLLTESDRSKHASIFRDILVSHGKCCADIQAAARLRNSVNAESPTDPFCLDDALQSRYFKVEKSRPEVYQIVSSAFKNLGGWKPLPDGPHWEYAWNILWTWRRPRIDYNRLLSFQKVNHFPDGRQLTRKDNLKKCIERFQKAAGRRADFFRIIPKTFLLPKEYTSMVSEMCEMPNQQTKQKRVWICKPKDSSQGRGIFLTNSVEDIRYTDSLVVQEYIANPLLLNGRKFDLRLYVLVTSFNPLEAFIYKQGFARIARVPFSLEPEHLCNRFMHLTNAAVQSEWRDASSDESDSDLASPRCRKSSPASPRSPLCRRRAKPRKPSAGAGPSPGRPGSLSHNLFSSSAFFELGSRDTDAHAVGRPTEDLHAANDAARRQACVAHEAEIESCSGGSKILLDELRQRLDQRGIDWGALWQKIVLVILKSLWCCGDSIPHHPNAFELFGYDILVDEDLKPWLIEVNSSPSMGQEQEADRRIKPRLIEDTLRLVNPLSYDRLKLTEVSYAHNIATRPSRRRLIQDNRAALPAGASTPHEREVKSTAARLLS